MGFPGQPQTSQTEVPCTPALRPLRRRPAATAATAATRRAVHRCRQLSRILNRCPNGALAVAG